MILYKPQLTWFHYIALVASLQAGFVAQHSIIPIHLERCLHQLRLMDPWIASIYFGGPWQSLL